jgi:hypothetical protein
MVLFKKKDRKRVFLQDLQCRFLPATERKKLFLMFLCRPAAYLTVTTNGGSHRMSRPEIGKRKVLLYPEPS